MSLTKTEAEKLFSLGFKRPEYADEVYPQDFYEYNNGTWVIGGRIIPSSTLLCNEDVYRHGVWIPSTIDLVTWLEEMDCKFILTYDGSSYMVEVSTANNQMFKGKGISIEMSLFKAIIKILQTYGGAPVQKSYKVIEVDFIEREDI
ncbi:hypothetical protein [Ureibacillus sinduriensis]|uniref:Uncharacterized protein n=1 Tax=Ureibacillus sinduriensis BLB-1 = JCM 15800 TaxID=1384057 RepID=A0A0A3IIM4_9BACL|nr:hypothetical protein [Ureibacillus sinduriensis]KGR74712.1 hypothetical protein CD33_16665 [Ureibacillus sinduriensis BLB-1 = JCM 15800]